MKMVSDARDWWKWNSTHIALVITSLPWAWSQLPEEFKAMVPEAAMPFVGAVLFIAFLVARVRAQD